MQLEKEKTEGKSFLGGGGADSKALETSWEAFSKNADRWWVAASIVSKEVVLRTIKRYSTEKER